MFFITILVVKMSHKKMIYKKNYIENKDVGVWRGDSIKCISTKLMTDSFGYVSVSCQNIIKNGDSCYFKDCECKRNIPYCSEKCCWNNCSGCNKKICWSCYGYRNMNCVYCAHKGLECECDMDEYFCGNESESC